jgi:membrane-associated phospholipid phosphatase
MAAQVTGVESTILLWIHRFATPALDAVFRFSNLFGLFPVCTAVVAAMVVRHIWRGERKEALLWLTIGVATAVVPEVIKHLVARPRPTLWPVIVHASGFSFPSGHAVAGAAFYPLMGWDLLRRRAISAQIGYAIGAVFGIFVGCGRLYLGVHWPSDVLAGWFLGFLQSGAAVVWLARRSQESALR